MIDGAVHRFLQEYYPYWLEAMSLVGEIAEAITMMMKLERLIDESRVRCDAGVILTLKI